MSEPPPLFQGRLFRVVREVVRAPDGREHSREIVRHPGAVAILPILDDGRVCLIENYRIAVGQTLLELPAGTREPGEDPLETARRELAEETGYRAGRIEALATFYMSPGILDEQMHLFLATQLAPGPAALEGGEQIHPRPTSWEEAISSVRDGRIQDAKTIVGLLYYAAFRR
ncbi:MAG: NUDIX hydrolase [Pirellulales bacterium]|nr:NUDIX hydrolase [Pirellulales bacterium]